MDCCSVRLAPNGWSLMQNKIDARVALRAKMQSASRRMRQAAPVLPGVCSPHSIERPLVPLLIPLSFSA